MVAGLRKIASTGGAKTTSSRVVTSRSSTASASGGSRATSSGHTTVRVQNRTGLGPNISIPTIPIRGVQSADPRVAAALEKARQRIAAGLGTLNSKLTARGLGQQVAEPALGRAGVRALVAQQAQQLGWTGNEMAALNALIMKESGYNPNAQNPHSTAYGIFQFLNSTWKGVGATKTADAAAQTAAGLRYIRQRYGTPSRALQFHLGHGWY